MAWPWRIQYEGAIYHVMSRGVGRGKIFLANDDDSRFLKYVASAKELKIGGHHTYLIDIRISCHFLISDYRRLFCFLDRGLGLINANFPYTFLRKRFNGLTMCFIN